SRRALALAETGTHKRLGIYDTEDETLSWLIDDAARAIESAHVPYRGGVVVAEVREARSRAFLLDPTTGAEMPLAAPRGTLLPLGALPDGAWLGRIYAATQPDELVRFELPPQDRAPHPNPPPQGGRGLHRNSMPIPSPLAGEGRGGGLPLARPFANSV